LRIALFCALLLVAAPLSAHSRSMSYSLWDMDDAGATVRVRVSRLELTRMALDPVRSDRDDRLVSEMLAAAIRLRTDTNLCAVTTPPRRTPSAEGYVAYVWRVGCPDDGPRTVESSLLLDVAPSHLHFVRVRWPGRPAVEKVLTGDAPAWALDADPTAASRGDGAGTSVADYIALGVEHIVSGPDHLAFVVALLLLAGTLRDMVMLVTSFTIAHSMTLALAVIGFIEPEVPVAGALIGYSIALVGVENAWLVSGKGRWLPPLAVAAILAMAGLGSAVPFQALVGLALFTACHLALLARSRRPARLRAAVAFAFGLVHGFGFAGVMMNLDLTNVGLAPALFGFNLGVEIGQLAVLALVGPLLLAVRRSRRASAWVVDVGSAAATCLGSFWFVTRSF